MPVDRDRVVRALSRLRAGPTVLQEHRGVVGAVVVAALVSATWYAVRRSELDLGSLDLVPAVVAGLVAVPLTTVANALEHQAVGRYVGRAVPLGDALRTAVTATAANLLPLPAGIAVRVGDLKSRGAGLRTVGRFTLVAGGIWVATAAALAAASSAVLGARLPAVVATVVAVAAAVAAWLLGAGADRGALVRTIGAEVLSVAAAWARMALLLAAVVGTWMPARGGVLAASGVVTQAIGFLPAGLGLKEAATAALAAAVALPAAVGLVVALADRVIGLAVHTALAIPLWLGGRGEETA